MDVLDKLSGVTNVWVHRKTVTPNLLKTYENSRGITQQLVTFSFHGEVGMDLDEGSLFSILEASPGGLLRRKFYICSASTSRD